MARIRGGTVRVPRETLAFWADMLHVMAKCAEDGRTHP